MKKVISIVLMLIMLLSLTLSGCGQKQNTENQQQNNTASKDPLGKYSPEITLTAARTTINEQFLPGESVDNNAWTRSYKEKLGINIKYDWVVPADQYNTKLSVAIASKDLPDIFTVDKQNFAMCVESDLLADQMNAYKTMLSPLATQNLKGYDLSMAAATIDGKLYAFPNFGEDPSAAASYTYIRNDWLKALNLEIPKTQQDLIKVAIAFAKNDPDKNGKEDTIGIAAFKDLWGSTDSLEGFFNSYHAYPYIWVKGSDGKLQYGSIQPEIKNALKDLQMLYKEGILDKEFGVKTSAKVDESVEAGKVGILYGRWWSHIGAVGKNYMADKNADWINIMPASVDNKPALLQSQALSPTTFIAINKDCQYTDAYVKMVNLFHENMYGATGNYELYGVDSKNGITPQGYALGGPWPYWNVRYDRIQEVLTGKKDASTLNPEQKMYYDNVIKYKNGQVDNVKGVAQAKMYGEGANTSYAIRSKLLNTVGFMNDEFVTFNTATMTEKGSTLKKMQDEAFTKIIMGQETVDYFDKFVQDWLKLGGQDITTEVNKWYSSQKK